MTGPGANTQNGVLWVFNPDETGVLRVFNPDETGVSEWVDIQVVI